MTFGPVFIACSKDPFWHSQKCTASIFRIQEVLSKHLFSGGNEQNQKTSNKELVSKLRFEWRPFRLWSSSTRHSTMFRLTRWPVHYTGQLLWNTQCSYRNFTLGQKIKATFEIIIWNYSSNVTDKVFIHSHERSSLKHLWVICKRVILEIKQLPCTRTIWT